MLPALDISRYQGAWQDYPCDIVMIKMTGGDAGLYSDPDAGANFNGAFADGKGIGGYHFVGWTEGAAVEANYFVNFTLPLTENQVYALDCENGAVDVPANAVQYVLDMANTIHDAIGVWPLIYMNQSTLQRFDWSPVLALCGLWLANWTGNPNSILAIGYNGNTLMAQFMTTMSGNMIWIPSINMVGTLPLQPHYPLQFLPQLQLQRLHLRRHQHLLPTQLQYQHLQ